MLKQSEVHPTIPVTDLDRARSWYADKPGMTLSQLA
jgi:catechol 2,3-dioxygenase-like lactoylglutathione lyase family enzyme